MKIFSRRDFSRLMAASPLAAAGGPMPVRRLGKVGFQAGILGFGAQRIGETGAEQSAVDRIVAEGIELGMNYVDTAPNYGQSEVRLGRALKGKRDKVFLVSKIETRTKEEALGQVRESLRRLETDHLDAVLFHNIGRDDRWPDLEQVLSEQGALGGLMKAKKQGMIRHIGCTSHSGATRVIRAFETGQMDLFMGVLNFVEKSTYGLEDSVLPEAQKRNIGVIAMKALGGPVKGPGARLGAPEDYQKAMRYVWGLPALATAIIGLRSPEELRQAVAAAKSFQPLPAAELRDLRERGRLLAAAWGLLRGPVVA